MNDNFDPMADYLEDRACIEGYEKWLRRAFEGLSWSSTEPWAGFRYTLEGLVYDKTDEE